MRSKLRRDGLGLQRAFAAAAGSLFVLALFAAGPAPRQETPAGQAREAAGGQVIDLWTGGYDITAHFLFFNLGSVGTMSIEADIKRDGNVLKKYLSLKGDVNKEHAQRYDYHGEFITRTVLPLKPDGTVDEEAVKSFQGYEKNSSGFLKLNKKYEAEKITFLPGRAVATREDGSEKTVEGDYASIMSPLDYLMDHEIKVGETIELPYVLNGAPHVFRCEVKKLEFMDDFKSRAYQIDISSYDKTGAEDATSKDVWKKKGNVRVWFCKEGPYRNRMLRMRIKFRWYLWLNMELEHPAK
jgi:hypothetical protein